MNQFYHHEIIIYVRFPKPNKTKTNKKSEMYFQFPKEQIGRTLAPKLLEML